MSLDYDSTMAVDRSTTRAAFIRQSLADVQYIHVFGEVDIESDDEFRAAIRAAAMEAKHVVIDLTRCTYIGSQGFAVLVTSRALADLAVIASPKVRRVMEVVGLSSLLIDSPPSLDGLTKRWDIRD